MFSTVLLIFSYVAGKIIGGEIMVAKVVLMNFKNMS